MQSTGPHTWWQISYTRHWQYTNWSTLIITCSSVSAVIQYSLYLYELMLSEQCPGVWVPWSAMVGVTHVPLVWLTHCSSASLILTPETLLWSCTGPGTLRQLFISRLWKHFTNFDKCVWKMAPHNYRHSLWSQNIWTLYSHSNYNDDDDSLVSFKTDLSFFPFMALEGFNFHDLTILNISFTYNAKVRCILN